MKICNKKSPSNIDSLVSTQKLRDSL